MKKLNVLWLAPFLAVACNAEPPLTPEPQPMPNPDPYANEPASVQQARKELKTVIDLHTTVIQRSCSPTGGVCHNGKEFPDMRSAGSMIAALDTPCNRDRFDTPEMIFDGCEQEADRLVITGLSGGEWSTRIGFLGPEEYDDQTYTVYRRLVLEDATPNASDKVAGRIARGEQTLINLPANITTFAGSKEARIVDTYLLDYTSIQALKFVRVGDPNGNGVFGASQPWMLIAPGHPDRSYLVGRITGTVQGTRMPLANQPLSDAEYVAIICWIETMSDDPGAHDAIDYDHCNFAKHPQSYSLLPHTN